MKNILNNICLYIIFLSTPFQVQFHGIRDIGDRATWETKREMRSNQPTLNAFHSIWDAEFKLGDGSCPELDIYKTKVVFNKDLAFIKFLLIDVKIIL